MDTGGTDEFRKDAERIALTGGLTRRWSAPVKWPINCDRVIPVFGRREDNQGTFPLV